ncbi:MAG TPA: PilZ domain-containing protein [Nitrospiria bacterium]|nr:PilZ domain-containing protein [Nitrospiria bacterium]
MENYANRREFTRVKISVAVELTPPGQPKISGRGRDLSVKGVYVSGPRQLPASTECPITIFLTGGGEPMSVRVLGRIVYADKEGMGIEFSEMDTDSFIHLQNLVLRNSLDPAKAEREFQEHSGIKRKS